MALKPFNGPYKRLENFGNANPNFAAFISASLEKTGSFFGGQRNIRRIHNHWNDSLLNSTNKAQSLIRSIERSCDRPCDQLPVTLNFRLHKLYFRFYLEFPDILVVRNAKKEFPA